MAVRNRTLPVLLLALLCALCHAQAPGAGLVFDMCKTSSDCKAPRQCYDTSLAYLAPCSPDKVSTCVCYKETPDYCSSSSDCPDGEICAFAPNRPFSCYSANAVDRNDGLTRLSQRPSPIPAQPGPANPPLWVGLGSRNRGDVCNQPLQCGTSLFCLSLTTPGTACMNSGDTCRCVPDFSGGACSSRDDCTNGDVCVKTRAGNTCLPNDIADIINTPTQGVTPLPSVTPAGTDPSQNGDTPLPSVSTVPSPVSASDMSPSPSDPATTTESTTTPPVTTSNGTPPPGDDSGDGDDGSAPDMSAAPDAGTDGDGDGDGDGDSSTGMQGGSSPMATIDPSTSEGSGDAGTGGSEGTGSTDGDDTNPSQSPDTGDPVCVAAHHLAHIPQKHLVFASHRAARVLCDVRGSCATPGHMVLFNGRAMMMKSYCALDKVSCTSERKLVNSVKLNVPEKMFRRVPSRTDGLVLSPFAARFESKVEEAVLVAVMRFNL